MSAEKISWKAVPNGSARSVAAVATEEREEPEPDRDEDGAPDHSAIDRAANGSANGSVNGSANGSVNGSANGTPDEVMDGATDQDHGRARERRREPKPRPSVNRSANGAIETGLDEQKEPGLVHYLRVLRRRIGIVLLVPVLTVGLALVLALTSTRAYQASADVLLKSSSQESVFSAGVGGQPDPAREVETQIEVLQSNPIEGEVDKKLGAAAPEVSSVMVSGVGLTDVIRITVESASPTVARRAANLYASTYITARRARAVDDLLEAGTVLEQKLADIQVEIDGASISAERDALTAQYQLLRDKLDQVQVDASLGRGGASVVAPATTPTSPSSPRPLQALVLALVIGLLLGVGLAFLLEVLDDKTHTIEDVARYGAGLIALVEVPTVPGWRDRKTTHIVGLEDPTSPAAESYGSLRTSLQIIALREQLKTILVTSPMAAEGKTTTAVNLGVSMARAGRRVAVVDLDLRRPRVGAFFGIDDSIGVTSVLVGDVPLGDALRAVEVAPGVPPLTVLGSGPVPSNPSEVLGAKQVGELLASLESSADVVIIDAPPLLPVTDALVLSSRVDGVLLVVAADETRRRHLGRAVDLLGRAEAPVLGAVLNRASRARRRDYGGGYTAGYGYRDGATPDRASRASARVE